MTMSLHTPICSIYLNLLFLRFNRPYDFVAVGLIISDQATIL